MALSPQIKRAGIDGRYHVRNAWILHGSGRRTGYSRAEFADQDRSPASPKTGDGMTVAVNVVDFNTGGNEFGVDARSAAMKNSSALSVSLAPTAKTCSCSRIAAALERNDDHGPMTSLITDVRGLWLDDHSCRWMTEE